MPINRLVYKETFSVKLKLMLEQYSNFVYY